MVDAVNTALAHKGDRFLCPACRVDLVMSERQGIEIDYCPKCRGVWLDRGELDKIIERSASEHTRAAQTPPDAPQPAPQQGQPYPSSAYYGGGHGSDKADMAPATVAVAGMERFSGGSSIESPLAIEVTDNAYGARDCCHGSSIGRAGVQCLLK